MSIKVSPQGPDGAVQYNQNKRFKGSGYLAVELDPVDPADNDVVKITDYVNAKIPNVLINATSLIQTQSDGVVFSHSSSGGELDIDRDTSFFAKELVVVQSGSQETTSGIQSDLPREGLLHCPNPPTCSKGNGSNTTLRAQNSENDTGGGLFLTGGNRINVLHPVNTGGVFVNGGIGFGNGNRNGNITLASGKGSSGIPGGDVIISGKSNTDVILALGTHGIIFPKVGGNLFPLNKLRAGVAAGPGEPYQMVFSA